MPDLIRYGKVCFESYTPFYTERTERLHSMLLNCGHELAARSTASTGSTAATTIS